MITLTKSEKASRYDALQAAIRYTLEAYRKRQHECDEHYSAYGAGPLGAYSKGMADAYSQAAETLERWLDA